MQRVGVKINGLRRFWFLGEKHQEEIYLQEGELAKAEYYLQYYAFAIQQKVD